MKILIIADVYPPEVSSAASLIQELSQGLAARGDEVIVATTHPKHYLADKSLAGKFDEFMDEGGIKVIRIKTPPLKKVNFIIRGVSQLLLPFLVFRKARKYAGKNLDGVIVYSPPVTLPIAGALIKRKYGAKFLLNLQDIFPQNAIDLGILKNGLAIKFFEAIEKFAYKSADVITFHSAGGRKFLIEKKHVPENKIVTLENWIDLGEYGRPAQKDFRKIYGLEGKKIFLFAGIMGPAQGMEFLVEVANKVKDIENTVFLLVGDGMEKPKVAAAMERYGLKNISLQGFVSKEDYPDLAAIADVGIVCLSSQNKTPFVPGKFLGYMAAGKPILAFLNKESDAFELVSKTNCGLASVAGDMETAEKNIRELAAKSEQEMATMGQHGREYAEKNLSLEFAVSKIRGLLNCG